jgi:hypothetical protein
VSYEFLKIRFKYLNIRRIFFDWLLFSGVSDKIDRLKEELKEKKDKKTELKVCHLLQTVDL